MRTLEPSLHPAQVSILHALRHAEQLRFSDLMRPTGMQSDSFKFHIRTLSNSGYISKTEDGHYQLTPTGKVFANNLDRARRTTQRQPKLSVVVIVADPDDPQSTRYLFQRRARKPYFGYWSCIGGPVQWGEDAAETARKELYKQTGLTASCTVKAFYRIRDFDETSGALLEDKLFIITEAHDVQGTLSNTWYGGHNEWMTEQEYTQQTRFFPTVCDAMAMLRSGQPYATKDIRYELSDY